MKKIIILAAMLATGAVNAATVCGTPDSDGGPKIILAGATSDLSLPSFYKVTCITGYGDYGIPNDLPNYDRVCVTYTGTTTDSSNYIYTLQNCRVDYGSSQCSAKNYYVGGDTGCRPCATGAYANYNNTYHQNSSCEYCEYKYKYVSVNQCELCPDDLSGGFVYDENTYHKNSDCYCPKGTWHDEAAGECKSCPCGGINTATWPTSDPYECELPAGGVCEDETGTYTVTKNCYPYNYN